MDFADNRREEVLEYAKRKFGADKVAQIGTFGTMMAKGVIKDVARVLGFSFEDSNVLHVIPALTLARKVTRCPSQMVVEPNAIIVG